MEIIFGAIVMLLVIAWFRYSLNLHLRAEQQKEMEFQFKNLFPVFGILNKTLSAAGLGKIPLQKRPVQGNPTWCFYNAFHQRWEPFNCKHWPLYSDRLAPIVAGILIDGRQLQDYELASLSPPESDYLPLQKPSWWRRLWPWRWSDRGQNDSDSDIRVLSLAVIIIYFIR